eukprot:CAMPEP_0114552330 /NCGR_PEP_ID=MMETSP0114-20121206/7070_1 /TAXON_ID=31324 /ORGANISM="Goniomonas sp, Strain m" /LENGTH=580 /DNA_ID=CAMNT_0001737205 /DNA_START=24 /DNA_END=1766 /DNA_ORIENTATION=+
MVLTPGFTWSEDDTTVSVVVTLPAECSSKKSDITCTSAYLKVNCPPAFLLIDLHGEVEEESCVVTLDARRVVCKMTKKTPGIWGSLKATGTKQELAERRRLADEASMALQQKHREIKKKYKIKEDDMIFRGNWDLQKEERRVVEDAKEAEKAASQRDIAQWAKKVEGRSEGPQPAICDDESSDEEEEISTSPDLKRQDSTSQGSKVDPDVAARYRKLREEAQAGSGSKPAQDPLRKTDIFDIPPPRATAKCELNFTPKPNNLPARERLEEDEEDLKEQGGAAMDASQSMAAQNAVWLKDRGDGFFRGRNFPGAVNAYTSALELDPMQVSCLSNRAAAFLHLGAYAKALVDAGAAISLLDRQLERNKDSEDITGQSAISKALARRGAAHLRLGMLDLALKDLERAKVYAPGNEALQNDVARLCQEVQASPFLRAKKEGDAKFAAGDLDGALVCYDAAIAHDDGCFQAYSNRAAVHLSAERYRECVSDCDRALFLIDGKHDGGDTKLGLRVLVRRGTAHCWLGQFDKGRADLIRAVKQDPHNPHLRQDVSLIVSAAGGSEDDIAGCYKQLMEQQVMQAQSAG